MNRFFFGWTHIKYFITELVLTLTGKESRFSQKKVLIYLVDISMLIATLCYIWHKRNEMTATDLCMIVGMWLAKGVSNTFMAQGDKKMDLQSDNDQPIK